MIIFRKLRWKNFLSTGNAFTELQLDRHSNILVIGENGSGKSTMLDALCFALFGKPFRNINKPTLINSINRSDLVVEVEFDVGPESYKVVRGIKPNVFEIYKAGKLINQEAKSKDYQEHLESFIIKMNYKTFTQVVILGAASFTPFMQLAAADRRAIIEDLLDIQIFSAMNIVLKNRIKSNETATYEVRNNVSMNDEKLSLKKKHLTDLESDKKAQASELENKITETQAQIDMSMQHVQKMQSEIENLQSTLEKKMILSENVTKLRSMKEKLHSTHAKLSKDEVFWSNTSICPTCESSIAKEKSEAKIHSIHKKYDKIAENEKILQDKIESANKKIAFVLACEKKYVEINNRLQAEMRSISVNTDWLTGLQKKKLELSKSNESLLQLQEEMQQLSKEGEELEKRRTELHDEVAYLEAAAVLLKDTGIKTKIIKQYLPIINKLLNKFLAEMDFFVNFNLDESFKEIIKSRYRDEFSYENFSEGEKQRIDLSILLTWREVAKLKNSASTNLLILDEIFDGSLDAEGVEYLMKVLHSLDKCNLFVISHKRDIMQDKFRSIIHFEKQGNYSRIVKGT
jgi:DNA repair exonuclease SbcCD ATPase subunit